MKCIYRRQYICICIRLSSIRAYYHRVHGFEELFRHARSTLYPSQTPGGRTVNGPLHRVPGSAHLHGPVQYPGLRSPTLPVTSVELL